VTGTFSGVQSLIPLIERFGDHQGGYQPSPLFGAPSREEWSGLRLIHAAHHVSFLVPKVAEPWEPS
jgi:hypothetical protein